MKKLIYSFMLLASISAVVCSCDGLNHDEEKGTLYGHWVLDSLLIEASVSVIGSGSQNTSVIDFTDTPCFMSLGENLMATARMGLDIDMSFFSYDATTNKVHFDRTISVSNDGKAMVLIGTYEVAELTPCKLVLRQPDFSIDIPLLFSSHQTALYTYHRQPENIP